MDTSNWRIDRQTFSRIQALWRVEIDLFASAWNAQLPTFVSWIRQPLALSTNAFSLILKDQFGYAFPPFALIPRCLAKIRKKRASLVLVCPWWPAQPWYPLLLKLAADAPRVLHPLPDLLTNSVRVPHPLSNSLILTVWKVSGDAPRQGPFRVGYCPLANRATTNSSYQSAWNRWFNWCSERDFDPLSNDLATVFQYLTDLHNKGYATRSVNVHRSMLSMTLDPVGGRNIGEHPLVVQLLKGCYNVKPPQPRYDSTWGTEIVTDYLASLGNDQSLDFTQLSLKLVTDLALATLMRTAELHPSPSRKHQFPFLFFAFGRSNYQVPSSRSLFLRSAVVWSALLAASANIVRALVLCDPLLLVPLSS
jgi:hypothetical protein